ncbi:6781_t:CDS:10 [Funneliformis mosseae]|uniref:6781_t:CDS:1 n=1 Tax=Funneliformis mosseae TaxID=27381 RepID=A0A9N9CKX0_FUNMO|nr:6781_t:CDS:10 [Funneliformis mosseae]
MYWPFAPASDAWRQSLGSPLMHTCSKADFDMLFTSAALYAWKQPLGSPLMHACLKADFDMLVTSILFIGAFFLSDKMYDSTIEEYLNTTRYNEWSILSILKYTESKHGLCIDNVNILKDEIYTTLRRHYHRENMQQRAISKLDKLLKSYDKYFNAMEVEQFMNELRKKEEERNLHTSIRRNMIVSYNVEALKDHHQNKKQLMNNKNIHTNRNNQVNEVEKQNENASDVVSEKDIFDFDVDDDTDDQMQELEATTNMREDESDNKWILSTGKDVYKVLNEFKSKIPLTKAYLYPAYFGILDLSGEEPEIKGLFTVEEWAEMKADFNKTVVLKETDPKEEELLYDLFDKIEKVLKRKSDDIVTDIEECIIKGHPKINVIRRLIQTYAYNLDRSKVFMSEGSFSNNFTNMMTKGIITYYQKFAGEIQSLSSAMIANLNKKLVDRSLIGQRCDFRITCDGFEAVIGLRSGGLPEACSSKRWNDKVDLMVAMRDVLLQEAIENNGVECTDFRNLYTFGVHSYGFYYNLYALDWKAKGLWRLGLMKKTKLPQSNNQLLIIEKLTTLLLRIEICLCHHSLAVKASRLHRDRRSSIHPKPYTFSEQGCVRRKRIQKDSQNFL